jgi:predicted solute-binding protein
MYVNELTLDYGAEGQEAVGRLLDEAYSKNLIPKPVALEFV